ncbi:MAG: hypothetical protein KKF41_03400 [Actinobacteria bacterium]|nr:hypothetical protein [Actinomycetota bacterium]MBU1945052.1 hypothetical protein [Actinomycetota bacterium]MBU2686612.1 hypothetical protein [Actinomycetota bacterium]
MENRTIAARARLTVSVDTILGEGVDSSVFVESDMPIVAERPLYFLYHNMWPGGSDTIGATYP